MFYCRTSLSKGKRLFCRIESHVPRICDCLLQDLEVSKHGNGISREHKDTPEPVGVDILETHTQNSRAGVDVNRNWAKKEGFVSPSRLGGPRSMVCLLVQ